MRFPSSIAALATLLIATSAWAQTTPATLAIQSSGLVKDSRIPDRFVSCVADGLGGTRDGGNVSPSLSWSGAPDGTRSYAVMVVDTDVPVDLNAANVLGKVIPAAAERKKFYHWVITDIPATSGNLAENAGKAGSGLTKYRGPCPPWNDERLHHYHFIVHALDVPVINLSGEFTGQQAEDAMASHILATGEIVGTYATNANVK